MALTAAARGSAVVVCGVGTAGRCALQPESWWRGPRTDWRLELSFVVSRRVPPHPLLSETRSGVWESRWAPLGLGGGAEKWRDLSLLAHLYFVISALFAVVCGVFKNLNLYLFF